MRLLITGASGHLGAYLLYEMRNRASRVDAWSNSKSGQRFGFSLRPVCLTDERAVADAFGDARPDVIIHAAAASTPGDCYADPQRARAVNIEGTRMLAGLAEQSGCRLVTVSTDLVFDGEQGHYNESKPIRATSVYGQTKIGAEQVTAQHPNHAIIRISLLFGPSLVQRPSFFDQQVEALRSQTSMSLFEDEWRTPLSSISAAKAILQIAESDYHGLLHVGGPERMNRYEMGLKIARALDADSSIFTPVKRSEVNAAERRPRDVSLDCGRWRAQFPAAHWPGWESAFAEFSSRTG